MLLGLFLGQKNILLKLVEVKQSFTVRFSVYHCAVSRISSDFTQFLTKNTTKMLYLNTKTAKKY
ncbi:MAG: hypothetical protein RIQ59_1836 [Bacteroidota bacterium]|jgi:hypothetical protein